MKSTDPGQDLDQVLCNQLLARMHRPIATVLGSGIPDIEPNLHVMAKAVGTILVQAGYSVLTGGGPGVMDAINTAASASAEKDCRWVMSAGIRVRGIDDAFECPACHESIVVHSFGARKHCLLAFCDICVVLPGGIGTADELWHLLNYIKHDQTHCQKVILLPSHFWTYHLQWLHAVVAQRLAEVEIANKVIAIDDVGLLADCIKI